MRPIVVFGAGGFGREVHELIEDINDDSRQWDIVGFIDGDPGVQRTMVHGLSVLGDMSWLRNHPGAAVALGVGSPATKARLVAGLRDAEVEFPTLVHPDARIGRRNSLGQGVASERGRL